MTTITDKTRPTRARALLCALLLLFPLFATPAQTVTPSEGTAFTTQGYRGPLKVSSNGRYLTYSDGTPFFYLGDTAWEIYQRLKREEVDQYLQKRAAQGFTVIQTAVLAEYNGLRKPNQYGHVPLFNLDPTKPNDAYFKHVDYVVNKTQELGMYTAMMPTWGDKWNDWWGIGPLIFNPKNARTYGAWIGNRYKGKAVIWILGGDRIPTKPVHYEIIRAMAEGIRSAVGKSQLITYHPHFGRSSADFFHNDSWMDFNFVQSGNKTAKNYNLINAGYRKLPAKPVMDSEPIYEGSKTKDRNRVPTGITDAYPMRQTAYWSLLAGAFGYTYGHLSVFLFKRYSKPSYRQALDAPGAVQMTYVRRLMQSRRMMSIVPDQGLIAGGQGEGDNYLVSCRGADFAFAYAATGQNFTVNLGKFSGERVNAWWYNPRNGKSTFLGRYANSGTRSFDPPGSKGRGNDWILILDDAAKNYPAPDGTRPGNAPPPVADTDTTYRFYKAINFAGKALSIDGRNWQAGTAGGYWHNGRSFTNNKVRLSPATDDAREQMIQSSIWHYKQLQLTLTNLPTDDYRVYLYTWEDNAPHTYSMSLEGQTIVSNRSTGSAGTWKKHGPFKAYISDGTMRVTAMGQVNISGIELWREGKSSAARMDVQPEDQPQEEREAEITQVFPNPADDQVTLAITAQKTGPVDVAIYDAMGREVKRTRVEAQPGSTTVVIAVADLAPGFYFIKGGSNVTKKLVIDR